MSKYSEFPRNKHDEYLTPYHGALPLRKFLAGVRTFVEPCCANGQLIRHIESFGPLCVYSGDIQTGTDALTDPVLGRIIADAIITNPAYTWEILEKMLERFMSLMPTWLLLEADFKHTLQAAPYMPHCTDVVSVGRIKWFAESEHSSKGNYAWYRFHIQHTRGPTFHPRQAFTPTERRDPHLIAA